MTAFALLYAKSYQIVYGGGGGCPDPLLEHSSLLNLDTKITENKPPPSLKAKKKNYPSARSSLPHSTKNSWIRAWTTQFKHEYYTFHSFEQC